MEVGSWTDLGPTGVASTSAKPYNAIDPNLILVGGTYYLNFGSFWHDIYQVEMDSIPTSKGSDSAYNVEYNSMGTSPVREAICFTTATTRICCSRMAFAVVPIREFSQLLSQCDLLTPMTSAKPAAGAQYMIMMCRSTSATGGFVDSNGVNCLSNNRGTILLESHDYVYGLGGQ
jgi:arabinan endo-1,5-alpha-L-arabinosidase